MGYLLGSDLRMANADVSFLQSWDGMSDADRAKHLDAAARVTGELVQEVEQLRFVVLGLKNEVDRLHKHARENRVTAEQVADFCCDLSVRVVNALGLDHDDQPLR